MTDLRKSLTVLRPALACALLASLAYAEDPTAELLTAPYVRSYVRIVLRDKDASGVALDGRDVDYVEPLTILASDKIKFVIADYNPLTMEVRLDAVESDDPSHEALEKFVAAFYKTFAPKSDSSQANALTSAKRLVEVSECRPAEQAETLLIDFDAALRPGEIGPQTVQAWANGATGREGMRTQGEKIGAEGTNLSRHAATAKAKLVELETLRDSLESSSGDATVNDLVGRVADAQDRLGKAEKSYIEMTRVAGSGKTREEALKDLAGAREKGEKELNAAQKQLGAAEETLKAARAAGSCPRQVLAMLAVFFRTQPADQVARLTRLGKSATDLADSLNKTANSDAAWYPPPDGANGNAAANAVSKNYVLDSKSPKVDKVITVTVTAKRTTLAIADGGIEATAVPRSDSRTVLRMRERSLFAPEVGVGLVIAGVRTPTYGVVTNESGTAVVSKIKIQERDFKGALMLNAVCRCWSNSFLYPMFQFGIAADNDAPAIFGGVGFRFIRPKGLGISAGGVLAWVKDLDKLRIGSPVESQAAIDADLKAQPTVKPYFALHYSF